MGNRKQCTKCGGNFSSEECTSKFHEILGLEFSNPEYGKMHHFSVPSYNLQHNLYSKKGWIEVWKMLDKFVNEDKDPDVARKEINQFFNGNKKEFSMVKGDKFVEVENVNWSFTLNDVDVSSSKNYCIDVFTWARSVLEDSAYLLK